MKFQVPATITKITTMADKSLRLQVDTQELSADDKAKVFGLHDLYGWFMFSEASFKDEDLNLPDIPQPKTDDKKTPSQRLRSVIYVYWEQTGKNGDFESFYNQYMEKIINHIKDKLQ